MPSQMELFVTKVVQMLAEVQADDERFLYGDFFTERGTEQTFSPISVICAAYRTTIDARAYFMRDEDDGTTEFIANPDNLVVYVPGANADAALLNAMPALTLWNTSVGADDEHILSWASLQELYEVGVDLAQIALLIRMRVNEAELRNG